MNIPKRYQADLMLLLLTVLWGTSFPVTKIAMGQTGVFSFLTVRFLLGGLMLYPFVRKGLVKNMRELRKAGFILGFWMFIGFVLQTWGMKYTSASMSGFLTGTLVIMVPVLAVPFLKSKLRIRHIAAALSAMAGIFLLTRPDVTAINLGDLMTLGCAFSFAMQMIYVQKYSNRQNSIQIAFYQVIAVGIMALPLALFTEGFVGMGNLQVWGLALWAAIFCTAIAFWIQCRFQPDTSAQAAAIVYSMEPVFAALFAFLILGEKIQSLTGAVLIIAGMIIAEWRKK